MGSGKTTIGTLLARQLAWRFVDLDDRIEESAGLPIPQIFERLGEAYFRQLEADQLRATLGRASELKQGTVLALGGGTYAQPGCPEFLRASGVPVLVCSRRGQAQKPVTGPAFRQCRLSCLLGTAARGGVDRPA